MLKRLQMVWSDENERLYYYLQSQEKSHEELMDMFSDGYTDYYLLLDERMVKKDTYSEESVGKEISRKLRAKVSIQCFCSITEHSYSSLLDKDEVYLKDELTDKITDFSTIYNLADYCNYKLRFMKNEVLAELSPKNKLIREECLDFK